MSRQPWMIAILALGPGAAAHAEDADPLTVLPDSGVGLQIREDDTLLVAELSWLITEKEPSGLQLSAQVRAPLDADSGIAALASGGAPSDGLGGSFYLGHYPVLGELDELPAATLDALCADNGVEPCTLTKVLGGGTPQAGFVRNLSSLEQKTYISYGLEASADYSSTEVHTSTAAAAAEQEAGYAWEIGPRFTVYASSPQAALTVRAGGQGAREVLTESKEVCTEDEAGSTVCEARDLLAATPVEESSAYVQLALTRWAAGSLGDPRPGFELRARSEVPFTAAGAASLELTALLFMAPTTEPTGLRTGVGLQGEIALDDTSAVPSLTPQAYLGAAF